MTLSRFEVFLHRLRSLFHSKWRRLFVHVTVEGRYPVAVQRTTLMGAGKVVFDGRARTEFGWRCSGGFNTSECYVEARTPQSIVKIGEACIFNNGCSIIANKSVAIGRKCLFGTNLRIYDSDFHGLRIADRNNPDAMMTESVSIGDNCWIGDSCIILKGVSLGSGCVVAAGSVVTKSYPDNSIVGGNPARLIKTISQ